MPESTRQTLLSDCMDGIAGFHAGSANSVSAVNPLRGDERDWDPRFVRGVFQTT